MKKSSLNKFAKRILSQKKKEKKEMVFEHPTWDLLDSLYGRYEREEKAAYEAWKKLNNR